MRNKTPVPVRYRPLMRALHWLIALGIVSLFVCGPIMTAFDQADSLRAEFYTFHKSVGALVLALVLVRIVVRWRSRIPPLPKDIPLWERRAAFAGHGLLYLMMLSAPLTGWAVSDVYGYDVTFFDIPLPKFFPTLGPDAGALLSRIHSVLTYSFMALVGLHLLAIAKHRYIDRHCVMNRMA